MNETKLSPLAEVHFYASMTVPIDRWHNRVMAYGDVLEVTDEMRNESYDRNGGSWLDVVDDEERQIERWGRIVMGSGPWPSGMPRIEPGSMDEEDAREAAQKAAWRRPTEEEQAAALAAVVDRFGPNPVTSRTLETHETEAERDGH
jgi:hypothetical protein